MGVPIIRLEGIVKQYGSHFYAVRDLSLEIQEGEYICFLGPSGCGKTTTLRIIAGYVAATAGKVILDGKDITNLTPQQRNMGMVFQSYALFPHMTVADNVAFPLRIRRMPEAQVQVRVREMLELVRLPDAAAKRPAQLSGGQQQRVALARALSFRPRVLLLDEPLSALDVKLREHMQLELKQIQKQLGVTTIHVTHDQSEALSLADRVLVMKEGELAQFAPPVEIYEKPANRYVADFVGKINFLAADLVRAEGGEALVQVRGTDGVLTLERGRLPQGAFALGVRPEDVLLVAPDAAPLRGVVEKAIFVGADQYCYVRVSGDVQLMVRDHHRAHREGDTVGLEWKPDRLHIFAS